MPRGDRTGPWGGGPRTGRGAGYCGGYGEPGFMNPYGGRAPGGGPRFGFGWGPATEAYEYGEPPYGFSGPPGRGFGRGFGMGRAFGGGFGMGRGFGGGFGMGRGFGGGFGMGRGGGRGWGRAPSPFGW